MRALCISLFLSLSIIIQAQDYKNEIKVGVPGGYFFDNAPYRQHRLSSVPIPTYFSYDRILYKNYSISCRQTFFWLFYHNDEDTREKDEIIKRAFHESSIRFKYKILNLTNFKFILSSGISYRYEGGELFHVSYVDHGSWREQHVDYRVYNDFGFSIGTEFKYIFYKRFNLGIGIDYTRYLTEISPNQLSTAIFLGYEF